MISGLIDYAYTGEINITKHNVQSMLSAANLLGNILIKISTEISLILLLGGKIL